MPLTPTTEEHDMDIDKARSIAQSHGSHWFNNDTMRFFDSRVLPSSWTKIADCRWRFISSERLRGGYHERRYTIREMRWSDTDDTCRTETVGEFQQYETAKDARKACAVQYAMGGVGSAAQKQTTERRNP
jgi:hypothetical protein